MTRCPDRSVHQDYLDGLLAPPEAQACRAHAQFCPACSAELVRYERLLARLSAMPLVEPPPALYERVLARVLPSRARRRWMMAAGWGYAGALAGCLAAVVAWAAHPAGRSFLPWLAGLASERLVRSLAFVLQALSSLVLTLASGRGLLAAAAERLSPLARAMSAVLAHPALQLALALAAAACVLVLWWMKPREARLGKEIRHVGLLVF